MVTALVRRGIAAAALLFVATTSAAEKGWYVGAAQTDTYVDVVSGFFADAGPSSTGYALRGGLRLNDHLAVDFAFQQASNLRWDEDSIFLSTRPLNLDSRLTFDASSLQSSVVGILPFAHRWEAFARGGVASYRFSGDQLLTDRLGRSSAVSRPVSDGGTGLAYGFGVGVTLGAGWHVGLEVQSFNVGREFFDAPGGTYAWIDSTTLGVERRFGREAKQP